LTKNFYILFISSQKMISEINKHTKGKTSEHATIMYDRLKKMGTNVFFNPFIGLESGNIDIDTIIQNAASSGTSSENLLSNFGIDKLVDFSKLNEQLKDIKQDDIDSATKGISQLLGSQGDDEVNEICSTLVHGIVDEIKENGMSNICNTAKSVSEKFRNKLDKRKMEKTAKQLAGCMKNMEQNLKSMSEGNAGGDMGLPMDMIKQMISQLGLKM